MTHRALNKFMAAVGPRLAALFGDSLGPMPWKLMLLVERLRRSDVRPGGLH